MAPRISLALALHNHQPVGNFGWVFGDVYDQAYKPMLDALDRHPGVRVALHYTGPLLDWLRAERPEFLERLRALVERGQVELLGGGYYERGADGLPRGWLELMKRAMSTSIWRFSTTRMLHEYTELLYLPAVGVDPAVATPKRRVVTEAG